MTVARVMPPSTIEVARPICRAGAIRAAVAATVAQNTPWANAPTALAPSSAENSGAIAESAFDAASINIRAIISGLRPIQRLRLLASKPLSAPIQAYKVTLSPTVAGSCARSAEICDNKPIGANSEVTIAKEAMHSTVTALHIRQTDTAIRTSVPVMS
ncbi:hypothetical protein D3C85_1049240 [compost metagenome]